MAESFMPTDPWILARNRYMEDLDEDEKKIFATASLENLFYSASVAQKEHEAESKSRVISSKLEPFVTAIDQYGSALDVISNTYSLAMAPLWGSIRVLLHVARAFEKYFQKLIEMLTRIGDVLPRCRVYQSLFPSHAHLLQSISIAYLDIIHFCTDAKKTFRKLKKSMTVNFAVKLFWKDFAGDFEGTLTKFRTHIKNVEREVGIASMIECSNEQALARVDRTQRDKERQVAERDLLLSKLSSIRYIDKHLRERRKRHPGSGSWLKEIVEFKDWMATDRPACLWCHGIPGSGKTILASALIDALSMDEANRDISIQPLTSYEIISKGITTQGLIITYYYCDSSDPRSLESRNILGTIIKELLEQIAITDVLTQQLVSLNRPGIRVAESDELVPILLAVLKQFTKVYIFLDGLDECRKEERAIVLSTINKLVSCDCPAVNVLVTSQQEVDIAASLKRFPRLELSADRISSDISCFIKERVRSCIESGSLVVRTAGLESDIISALVDGAQGMFLWVSFQIEDLCDATSDYEVKETLQHLPKGMGETYARILQKISSVRTNMALAQRVFKWIICAKRPLLITELTEAIAFQPTDRSWNAEKIPDASRTIQACKNLVVLDEKDKTVRLAHHSVRKFLLEPPSQDSIPEFHFDLSEASIEAGELCVAYLSFSDFERQLTTSAPSACHLTGEVPGPNTIIESVLSSPTSGRVASSLIKMRQRMGKGGTLKQPSSFEFAQLVKLRKLASPSLLEKHLFLKYAIENWIGHTSDFSNHNTRIWSLFKDLAMNKPMPFDIRLWGDMQESNGLPYTALFRWAINAGHVPLLRLLEELPEGLNLDAYCHQDDDDEGQSSVVLTASRYGHANVIELLALLGYIHTTSGVPLIQAAGKGHHGAVRALLDHGLCLDGRFEALYKATEAGHENTAHLLLDTTPNTDLNDDWQRWTLFAAMQNSWDEITVSLLRKASSVTKALDIVQQNWLGYALHEAARRGLVGVVEFLLENGADVSKKDKRSDTPMHSAAFDGQSRVLQLLIDNGADIEAISSDGQTVLHTAAKCGHDEAMQLLLENGADVDKQNDSGSTALYWAALVGHLTVVRLLILFGADLERKYSHAQSALHIAAGQGHESIVLLLLDNGVDISTTNEYNETALHCAAYNGHSSVVETLIQNWANIEASDANSRTALHLAALSGHEKVLRLLLQVGAKIDVRSDTDGFTALHLAVVEGYERVRQLLLEKDACIDVPISESGETELNQAVLDRLELVMQLLLKRGADINSKDNLGQTALHLAVSKRHATIVQLLLEQGADTAIYDHYETAMHIAASEGLETIVDLLLAKGADANACTSATHKTALHLAVLNRHQAVVELLLDHNVNVMARDFDDLTPLHLAALHSWDSTAGIVQLLLQGGADPNACISGTRETALHLAVLNRHQAAVKLLLEHGANIMAKDLDDRTPLHLAVLHSWDSLAGILVYHGADVTACDSAGMTPLQVGLQGYGSTLQSKAPLDYGSRP